jgi:two-component system, sensor histidine kinase YesM
MDIGFKNFSIKSKLVIYFLMNTLITIIITGILVNIIFSNASEEAANSSTVQAINQANTSIENYFMNIEKMVNIFSANPEVVEFLRMESQYKLRREKISTVSAIRSAMIDVRKYYPEIYGITIVNKSDLYISNEMYRNTIESLIMQNWYRACLENQDGVYLMARPMVRNLSYFQEVSADKIICMAKALIDPSTNEVYGVIVIDLDISVLENILKNVKLGKSGFIYIVDSNDDVIYSPTNYIVPRIREEWFSKEESGILNKYILKNQFQFIYTTSVYTNWKIVGVFSLNETLKEVVHFRYYLIFLIPFIGIIALMFAMFFSSSIANPISKLRQLMKRVETGDLSVEFAVKYDDEIGQLGRSFNNMIKEMKNLIDMVYKEQRSKRHAELLVLQSQIKPHFLYNTFDTIHWMAKKYGAKDIIQVIDALTKLFRIGLSKGDQIITLSKEIEHVRSYLEIQRVRYEDMLEFNIEVSKETEALYVEKLILQPIVENSIYHGIKPMGEAGRIEIKTQLSEGCLLITVKDNGIGVTKEKLDKLNEMLRGNNSKMIGYGLFNVNERIKLSYGKEYGVFIDSAENLGTEIFIKFPIVHNRDNDVC